MVDEPPGIESISPEKAVEMHLRNVASNDAAWTRTSHESDLRPFLEWCQEEGGIEHLHDLTGRDLFEFRIWRRDGGYSNGQVDELAPATLDGNLSTVRSFLKFAATIDAVHDDLFEKVPLLDLSKHDEVSDSYITPERVPEIVDYLGQYEYAGRDHVVWTLIWKTGMRISGVRALDLRDLSLDGSRPILQLRHRPPTTPLKNDEKSERDNRIDDHTRVVLQGYLEGPRVSKLDDEGRKPLVTTEYGRVTHSAIRDSVYRWTRPCQVGLGCPHDLDPDSCEYTYHDYMSKCPSARSPHDVRKARVTAHRNENVPRGVVSDELDASEDVLDKHYDRASKRKKAHRRWRLIQE
ncbi:integrase [Halobacteriales archaeon SW_6_65_46]|nr:MAG: integrase [Halobacteriales archaeon SW_6_65_46]